MDRTESRLEKTESEEQHFPGLFNPIKSGQENIKGAVTGADNIRKLGFPELHVMETNDSRQQGSYTHCWPELTRLGTAGARTLPEFILVEKPQNGTAKRTEIQLHGKGNNTELPKSKIKLELERLERLSPQQPLPPYRSSHK